MRKVVIASSLLALGLTLGSAPVAAQFYVGGYATMPSGDYADYAKTGWMAEAGYGFWKSSNDRLTLWVSGSYGSNSHEGDAGDKTNLLMGLGSVTFNLTANPDAGPYLLGHVGYLSHMYKPGDDDFESASEGGLAFGGGLGDGCNKFWVEARYITASIEESTTAFIMIGAGISF